MKLVALGIIDGRCATRIAIEQRSKIPMKERKKRARKLKQIWESLPKLDPRSQPVRWGEHWDR